MPRTKSGFTLIELLIAIVIASIVCVTVLTVLGRKLVDDGDPIRLLKSQGYIEPKIVERHNFNAWHHGCTSKDKVAFSLTAGKPNIAPPQVIDVVVCCGDWFEGCTRATPL